MDIGGSFFDLRFVCRYIVTILANVCGGQKGCKWNQTKRKLKAPTQQKCWAAAPKNPKVGKWGEKTQPTINIETVIAAKSFHAFVFLSISMPVTALPETEIAALTSSPTQSRNQSQSQSQQTVFDCLTSGLDFSVSVSVSVCLFFFFFSVLRHSQLF